MNRRVGSEVIQFGLVGGANTLLTGAIFILLGLAIPQPAAYTIAYALGIAFAMVVTPRAVFGTSPSVTRRLAYGAWYLLVYALGLGLIAVLGAGSRIDRSLVAVLTIAITALISFIGARVLFTSRIREGALSDREP